MVYVYSRLFHPIPAYSSLSSPLQSIPTNSSLLPDPQSPIPNFQFGMPNCAFYPQLDICVLVLYKVEIYWQLKALLLLYNVPVIIGVQCSTVHCTALQCGDVQCSAVYSAVQCNAVHSSAVFCCTVKYNSLKCSVVQCIHSQVRFT